MKFILASKSPRRKEILENLGIAFNIVTAGTDESCDKVNPREYVEEVAARKGRAVYKVLRSEGLLTPDTLIISSDTVVAAGGRILGKPKDRKDAADMIRLLANGSHEVISGLSLISEAGSYVGSEVTEVFFTEVNENDLSRYLDTDEAYDKAGAYAIQGYASLWISGIRGDYFNVVGFPVKHFADVLRREFGVNLFDTIRGKNA